MLEAQPVETTLYSLDATPPDAEQRRTSERHLSLFRVGCLHVGERRELCLIRNISAGGMLIRAYSPIAIGERVTVELKQGETVSGVVRWTRDECVGVRFEEPIDVVGLISSSTEGKRPRMPRIQVNAAAWLREGAVLHRVTAIDISQGGVKIVSPAELPMKADVVLTLPGLTPTAGTVRWREGDALGITFNRPIGLPALVSWLHEEQARQRARAAG